MPKFPRSAALAPVDLSVDHDAHTNAASDCDDDEIVRGQFAAEPLLAQRERIDVIVDINRDVQPGLQQVTQGVSVQPKNGLCRKMPWLESTTPANPTPTPSNCFLWMTPWEISRLTRSTSELTTVSKWSSGNSIVSSYRTVALKSVSAATAWFSINLTPTTNPPRGIQRKQNRRTAAVGIAGFFFKNQPSSIKFPVMEVTVAGLSPIKCARSAREMGPCHLIAFRRISG